MNQNIMETARRLREVRRAQRQFLSLWALDCLVGRPTPLERLARDIETSASAEPIYQADWSSLYRGSVLDD